MNRNCLSVRGLMKGVRGRSTRGQRCQARRRCASSPSSVRKDSASCLPFIIIFTETSRCKELNEHLEGVSLEPFEAEEQRLSFVLPFAKCFAPKRSEHFLTKKELTRKNAVTSHLNVGHSYFRLVSVRSRSGATLIRNKLRKATL
jgi:hypothetical protein